MALGPAMVYAQAQTRHEAGEAKVAKSQITGEVVKVEGNTLVAKMVPGGEIRTFNIQPGQKFMIDGQPKIIGDLKTGTVLTATATTTTHDVRVRTQKVGRGTVWFVAGNTLILTQENGQNKQYNVPEAVEFTMDGKPAKLKDLKVGMKVEGSKMVEAPETVIETDVVVTGKAPK